MRFKVWTYDNTGNKVIEKGLDLDPYLNGVYKKDVRYNNCSDDVARQIRLYFDIDGVVFDTLIEEPLHAFSQAGIETKIQNLRMNFVNEVYKCAADNKYINLLNIKVCELLGYDVQVLRASREAYLAERERIEQANGAKRIAEQKRKEKERADAEIQLFNSGRYKLVCHDWFSADELLILAKYCNMTVHPRTLGFIRKNVAHVKRCFNGSIQYSGRGLNHNNLQGTNRLVEALYKLIKE